MSKFPSRRPPRDCGRGRGNIKPFVELLHDRIAPANLTVVNLDDSGIGSFRQAILDANASSEIDTIDFSGAGASGIITLTSGPLRITGGVEINGPGSGSLTVSGNAASGIFSASGSDPISIAGLTLASGTGAGYLDRDGAAVTAAYGGAIFADGANLSLNNLSFAGNTATNGGAILNYLGDGAITAQNCDFSSNTATAGAGAIWNNAGSFVVANCTFTGNSATDATSIGGAIANLTGATLDVGACTFSGNSAGFAAGAVYNEGLAVIANSTIADNFAIANNPSFGGGILNYSTGSLSLRDSAVTGNVAGNYGGGVFNGFGTIGGSLVVSNCTISNNTAPDFGGGIFNNLDAKLALVSSTVAGNSGGSGGGVYNDSNDFALVNSIVVNNTLPASATANNIAGAGLADSTRSKFNVVGVVSGTGLTDGVNDNHVGVSPTVVQLGTLGNHGGSTQTIPLQTGSIAIHAGSSTLTTLASTTNADATTFTLSDAFFVGAGQLVQVDNELMQVISVSGNEVTALRGINGSIAAGHVAGAAFVLPYDQRGSDRFPTLPVDVGAYQTPPAYSIITALPDWTVGQAYAQTLATVNGSGASTYQVTSGNLPTGFSLNASTGEVTGEPTAVNAFPFTITATDSSMSTTATNYTLTIHAAPTITTATLGDAFLNKSYSQTVAVSGGTLPFSFLTIVGSLPDGLTLNSITGVIDGSPTKVGDYSFTIGAADAAGALATHAYTIRVLMTLTAQAQLGSEVYSGRVTGHIASAQTNSYRIDLAAGQKLSVAAQTAPGLQATIQVLDPSSQVVSSGTAASAGATLFVQNTSAATTGSYTIVVGGAGGSAGDFSLSFDLDAQRETEAAGAATNNSIANAENIGAGFFALNSLVSRGALVSSASYAAAAVTPAFQDISSTGTLSATAIGDDATDTLTTAQLDGFTFPFFGTTYDSVSFSTNGLLTFGSANFAFDNVDFGDVAGVPTQASIAPLWDDLTATGGGVYWQVVGSGPTQQLVVQWNDVQQVGVPTPFTFEAVLSLDGSIQFNYDANLTAAAVNGATVGIKDAGVGNLANVAVDVDGLQPLGALVGAGLSVLLTPAAAGADYFSFTMTAGDVASVSVVAAGNVSVDVRNASDTVLATGVSGPTNLTKVVDRVTAPATGTYYVRVSGDSKLTYTVAVARNGAFDMEANDSAATSQNVTGAQGVVGYVEPGTTSSGYVVAAAPYDFVDISLPGKGTSIPNFLPDLLDPFALTNDDNAVHFNFPTGFQFPFFGTNQTGVWIGTNGILTFGTNGFTDAGNTDFTMDPTDAAIAAFWDDLKVEGRAASSVFVAMNGSGASQQLIVQWNELSFYEDYFVENYWRGGLTFQAILSADGTIRFNYKSLTTGYNGGLYDEGYGATAGIKDAGSDRVMLIGDPFHPAGPSAPVGTGKSVTLTPNRGPDWYSVTLSGAQSNLRVTTVTPGDDANQWGNTLNPKIELYDSSNALVASGTVGADGRNESILATGLTPGATYKIRLIGEASYGEYFLGASATGTPAVSSVVVNGGPVFARNRFGVAPTVAGQSSIVSQILVTFNQLVTLDADAFNVASLSGSVSAVGTAPSSANVAVVATGVPGTGDAVSGFSQYVLTFAAGAGVNSFDNSANSGLGNAFTAIKDGFYQLNYVGSKIHVGSVTAANGFERFWALYGADNPIDVQVTSPLGSGNDTLLVDGVALNDLYSTFGSRSDVPNGPPVYRLAFDSNLDGFVDGIDLNRGYANFGTIWHF